MRNLLRFLLRISSKIAIKKYQPLIIAITGNTGKTSTKESIFFVLKRQLKKNIRKTEKNLNTDIGVPLAIMGLKDARSNLWLWLKNFWHIFDIIFFRRPFPEILVLELAADKPGEIEYFSKFIPIDIGVVTAIGKNPVHLEFFSSRDRLIQEKSYIINGIKLGGTIILNRDDKDVFGFKKIAQDKGIKFLTYGTSEKASLYFSHYRSVLGKESQKPFVLADFSYKNKDYNFKKKNAIGEGFLYDIMPAILCGLELKQTSLREMIQDIEREFITPPGRMRCLAGKKNTLLIDDSYNASPLSYLNALDALERLSISDRRRKIGVLADMAELGKDAQEIHQDILKKALVIFHQVICLGPLMKLASEKILNQNKKLSAKLKTYSREEKGLFQKLDKLIQKNDIILFKGAQVMRMEKIVRYFLKYPNEEKLLVRQEKHWKTG